MQRIVAYTLIFFGVYTYQLFICYQTNLIPGTTGAYYLVQLRSLLDKGSLGFPDMPLYFNILAGLHKVITWVTGLESQSISLHLVKWVGAALIPLALVPWYFIVDALKPRKIPLRIEVLLALMLTCSFTPLLMLGNFQKNAFGVSLILGLIYWGIRYLKTKRPVYIIGIIAFFVLILLSHFGSLTFTLIVTGFTVLIYQGKKSWWRLLILGGSTLLILSVFDPARANRLLFILTEIFQKPALLYAGKPYIVLTLLNYLILFLGAFYFLINRKNLSDYESLIFRACLCTMGFITFPLLEAEYARRLSLMLFIPQVLVLFFVWQFPWPKVNTLLALGLSAYLAMSVSVIYLIKRPSLSETVYTDLKRINKIIKNRDTTIMVARHGLEWWVCWSLGVKVANGWGIDTSLLDKYEPVLFLEQKNNVPIMGVDYLADPKPKVGKLKKVYSSEHFRVYEWSL